MTFFNHPALSIPSKPKFSYVQLIVFGLNYSFKRIGRRRIIINLQFPNLVVFEFPSLLIIKVFKRRVSIFGNSEIIHNLLKLLCLQRPGNPYSGKGLRIRKSGQYKVKPGKDKKK